MAAGKKENRGLSSSANAAYVEFVDTLFADPKSLVFGLVLQVCLMAIFIFDTSQYFFSVFIVSAILGAIWRLHIAKGYKSALARAGELPETQAVFLANVWERKYVLPGTFAAASIGFFSFFGLQGEPSAFAITAIMVLLFTPLPTIVGRIYGSRRLATFLLFGQFSPVFFGYFVSGSFAHILLALLCIPYIALVLGMVDNVRATVVRAVEDNAEKVELGQQFDIALSNMSHGLIMFNEEGRVKLINSQASVLFNQTENVHFTGRSIETLIRYARLKSLMSKESLARIQEAIRALLARAEDRQQICIDDGRYLDLTISERTDGGVVMTIEDSTERVLSAQKIEHMARYDGLTGLANRQHFESEVVRYLSATLGGSCALIVIDIDDFKHFNDAIGHAQGDALLCSVANRIRCDGDYSYACRLGGDEFLLFIGGLTADFCVEQLVQSVHENVSGIHDLRGEQVRISCSIGFVHLPNNAFELDRAILSADLALYAAKSEGKGRWSEFDKSLDDQYVRRQKIKLALAKAIDDDALSLIYQPLVDAQSGQMVSCEALSRWHDPHFGQLSPTEYIPLAEEMGVVSALTAQTLRKATMQCSKWPEHISVSVNLSQNDFQRGDIVAVIDDALKDSGLAPHRLEIEVTETAVASNENQMIEKLREIHARGVRIALDDFGTGQSSLSYLHRLPLDKVKIDRSFVVGIDSGRTPLVLLRGVTELCATLGLAVTVEGVETMAQLELVVAQASVDRIQGYIYGPGLPASGIETLARMNTLPIKEAFAVQSNS